MSGGGVRWERVPAWVALVAVAVTGAAVVAVALVAADAVAPTTVVRAVVSENEPVRHSSRGGRDIRTNRNEARAEDGRALTLGESGRLSYGDPVVLRLSRATGHVVGVRSAERSQDRRFNGGRVLLLVLGVGVLVSAATWARGMWRVAAPAPTVAVAAAAVLAAGLVGLRGPEIDRTGPLPDRVGLQIYDDAASFPARKAATGDQVRVGNVTLTVTGLLTERPPAGAASWLGEFRVLVVPVRVTASGPGDPAYLALELIGRGPGAARLVRAADCGQPGTTFDGTTTTGDGATSAGQPGTTRSACFVVPAGFHAQHLVVSAAARDTTAIGVGLDRDG